MATKSTIAIIGSSGSTASAMAKSLAKGNNRLLLFGESEHLAATLSQEILALQPDADVEGIACPVNACWEADTVILDVPPATEAKVAEQIRPYVTQKIVVRLSDAANSAQALQQLLPYTHIVSASSTAFAPDTPETTATISLAGSNPQAAQAVSDLLASAGFRLETKNRT